MRQYAWCGKSVPQILVHRFQKSSLSRIMATTTCKTTTLLLARRWSKSWYKNNSIGRTLSFSTAIITSNNKNSHTTTGGCLFASNTTGSLFGGFCHHPRHNLVCRNPASSIFFGRRASSTLRSPTSNDVDYFQSILKKPNNVVTDPDLLIKYNTDWTKHYEGSSSLVLLPESTEEVSQILKYCHDEGIGVVPQGGNTGLVGGSVPMGGDDNNNNNNNTANEIVLSLEKMNRIHSFDASNGMLHCDAGCILQDLQTRTLEENYLVPIDLGAKGTCQIGGNIATNAGGQYYDRYGSLHANIIGLQVVVPDGKILNLNVKSSNRKDNTGYKLQHLFIGSEGTLGVVTQAVILCPSAPQSRCVALCACESFKDVQRCLVAAKETLNETLAAYEYMDRSIVSLVLEKTAVGQRVASRIPQQEKNGPYPYYILVETHGSNKDHDTEKMETFLERTMEEGCVVDGVLAQDETQIAEMWAVREECNPAAAATGYTYKYDLSFPRIQHFDDFDREMKDRLLCGDNNSEMMINNWGHISDGNLHFNVTTPGKFAFNEKVFQQLEPYVFETVVENYGGSISAEHGLGRAKNEYLPMVHGEDVLETMRSLKALFDPKRIMNPGKFLPRAV